MTDLQAPIQACIFDLDGTLVDSLVDIAASANHALARCGYPIHPVEAYRQFIGRGIAKLVEVVLPDDARTPATLDKMRRLFDEHYDRHYLDTTKPYPGITALLTELAGRGLRLAVVSNKPQNFVAKIIDCLFAGQFAAAIGQRPGVPRKPDPAGVFDACRELGVSAANCLYLGDSGLDMQTAVQAGALPVGVLWGFRNRAELEANGARIVIGQPGELLDFV